MGILDRKVVLITGTLNNITTIERSSGPVKYCVIASIS